MAKLRRYVDPVMISLRCERSNVEILKKLEMEYTNVFNMGVAVALISDAESLNPKLSVEQQNAFRSQQSLEAMMLQKQLGIPLAVQTVADTVTDDKKRKSKEHAEILAARGESVVVDDERPERSERVDEDEDRPRSRRPPIVIEDEDDEDEGVYPADPCEDALEDLFSDAEARSLWEKFAGMDIRDRRPWIDKIELWFVDQTKNRIPKTGPLAELTPIQLGKYLYDMAYGCYAAATAPNRNKE